MGENRIILDIDRSHLLGKRKQDNNVSKPIIIKLCRCNALIKIVRNLKGKCKHYSEESEQG